MLLLLDYQPDGRQNEKLERLLLRRADFKRWFLNQGVFKGSILFELVHLDIGLAVCVEYRGKEKEGSSVSVFGINFR